MGLPPLRRGTAQSCQCLQTAQTDTLRRQHKKNHGDSSPQPSLKISIDNVHHYAFYSWSHVAHLGRGELVRIKSIII